MKNFFTKAFVCAGVMTSTLALSSIAVFAATTPYILGDTTAISATTYDSNKYNGTTLNADTVLFGGNSSTYTITALGKTQNIGMVDLSGNNDYKDASSTQGELANEKFNKLLFTTGGTSKNFITIAGVSENQTIGVYWSGADSKGATGKSASIKIGSNTTSSSTAKCNYSEYTVGASETSVTIASNGSRVGVYAITIEDYDPSVTRYSAAMESTVPENYPTVTAVTLDSDTAPTTAHVVWSANDYYLAGNTDVTLTASMLGTGSTVYTIPYEALSGALTAKASAEVITSYTSLAAELGDNGDYTTDSLLGAHFIVNTTGTNKITVDDHSLTYGNNDITFTKWMRTGGANRNIDFTVKEASMVQVYFTSNSDTEARSITLDGKTVSSSSMSDIAVLTTTVTPTDTENGTTFSVIPNKAVNILDVRVTPGISYNAKSNGSTVVTSTDTYVLANVSEETVTASGENNLTLTITNPSTSSKPAQTVETDSVYKYVKIGNAYFEGNTYIFGAKITGANGKDIADGVTFSVS